MSWCVILKRKLNFSWKRSAVIILDMLLAVLMNAGYVAAMASDISGLEKSMIQVAMAAFKVMFNSVVLRVLISCVPESAQRARIHVALLVFNVIVAPCFASVLSSSSCFKELFTGSEMVCTSYTFPYCQEVSQRYSGGEYIDFCVVEKEAYFVNEYNPPFIYNYQCASVSEWVAQ